jgi:hypothetical protein
MIIFNQTMFQKDYILRMIEQFVKIFARILQLKQEKQYPQALQEIGEAYRLFFGLNPELIDGMSDEDLTRFLKVHGQYDPEKRVALATLLNEEAEVLKLMQTESISRKVKAFSIFLEAFADSEAVRNEPNRLKIESILESLQKHELPFSVKKKQVAYYELTRRFDRAEDLLFELLDSNPSIIESAIAFYERLRTLPERTLAEGHLPLDEVEEGLRTVQARKTADG